MISKLTDNLSPSFVVHEFCKIGSIICRKFNFRNLLEILDVEVRRISFKNSRLSVRENQRVSAL
jgi:hypothetical protein